jgi:thiol:disulfide interchange protein
MGARLKSMIVRAALLAIALLSVAELAATAMRVAQAQERPAQGHHVSVTLVAETRGIVPGHSFRLALRQQIETGWHTYWINPGDAGLPTTINWNLPRGLKAGPIQWPQPERIVYDSVVDYGYENEVLLPVDIEVPSTLALGTNVGIAADVSWLVCSDTCIPEDAHLSISVPVAASAEPDPDWTERLASARARLPLPNPFPTTISMNAESITLHVATGDAKNLHDVTFFPVDSNVIDNDAPQTPASGPDGLTLTLRRDVAKSSPATLNGLLVFRDAAAPSDLGPQAIAISSPIAPRTANPSTQLGLLWALLLAFAGGIILNLMPCVLPVLSIKAFSLAQHAQAAAREVRVQGIAYTAGVLASFAIIAALLLGARATGAEIGWGFQLQSPLFVAVMIYVLFAVGLNLSGVFSFGERVAGAAGELSSNASYSGSFLTGALATLVATPCTAPFMAAALGYAITQPWHRSLAIFDAVGFGMAFPYLAIAFSPPLRRFLPRPGAWMIGVKQFLAFPIYGTAVWLTFVLAQESGAFAVTAVLSGLVLIAFAAWLYEAVRHGESRWRRWGLAVSALPIIGAVALVPLADTSQTLHVAAKENNASISWLPFSPTKLDELQLQGKSIFVDFTADWCITCKINERIALEDPAVIKAFSSNEVTALRADWTRQDPSITRLLEANGRAGVPLYLFYPRAANGENKSPVILPQILTAIAILREIEGQR